MRSNRYSLAGKISAIFAVCVAVAAAVASALTVFPLTAWEIFVLTLPPALITGVWLLNRFLAPVSRVLESVSDGIRSFHDNDYTVRIAEWRDDELGDLVKLYNRVGEVLHEERKAIRQRELLLQTALDRSPAAVVLVNPLDRVIYCNTEARVIFLGGGKMKGRRFAEILENCPSEMRDVLAARSDGLFSIDPDGEKETYHVSRRRFTLNRQPHELYLMRRLTAELGRQEAEIWKKVIRVISHELNNYLAPISSLAHSGQQISGDPDRAGRLDEIFGSIRRSAEHLTQFLDGYARFARLPEPRKQPVSWSRFVETIRTIHPFELEGDIPTGHGYFDPAHMQQVITNLVKNAVEASEPPARIGVRIRAALDGGTTIQVMDRGRGLPGAVMRRALLPFYTTKRDGAGLGLPLCREIIEAHGGKLRIQSRDGGGTIVTCWIPPEST
jgi:nitrogen fixation/metabolism regulation signal transduction histidine kinase